MYYINVFFLYSILGHLLETFIYIFSNSKSGILFGFWTPIYGIGSIIIIASYKTIFKKKHLSKLVEGIIVFLIGAICLTIIEQIGGVLIEKLFHTIFWDYSSLKFNIGYYISLEMAILWGISSLILIFFLKPITDKVIKKIPRWATISLIILFIIDIILTIYIKII